MLFLIVTDHTARAYLCRLYSFKQQDALLSRWIGKLVQFDFDIKHEAGKKIPHTDCLSRVTLSLTEAEVKDCKLVNQVITKDKNNWSIELGKSVEQLVEHRKNAAELITLQNWIELVKRPRREKIAVGSRALWKVLTDFRNLRI